MLYILRRSADFPHGRHKTAIVCQFPAFADIIAEHLSREGTVFARFHDSDIKAKNIAMSRIKSEPGTTVALVTVNPADIRGFKLKRFGTVILMDLWWNPRLDVNAFHDDHEVRVTIYKLYYENTIESRVLELLSQPGLGDDCDIFPRLGVQSTPYNLDFVLKPA
ncbi:hypothetical protein FRC01_001737 [Tulasnella sp. 417]|nr:hypothetical protein FRC01_001737 [Tulasnella sp. 417]